MIVLDEADRMFDLGFEPQVTHIMDQVRPDRQTVMFSATFPRDMEVLARKILTTPIMITVGGVSIVPKQISQNIAILEEEKKFIKLLEILGKFQDKGSVIVFVHKQEVADTLQHQLMKSGYSCLALHGGIDQYDRDSVITDFKNGVTKILVATSVAARGLDVRDLILVVNFDTPNHYEDYVHRVGRTGRAGSAGYAWTFLGYDDAKYAGGIVKAFKYAAKSVPNELQKFWDDYKNDMKAQGKKIKNFSGFVGSGFKFDQNEENAIKEQRMMQKVSLGLEDDDDENSKTMNSAVDIDKQIEEKFNLRKRTRTHDHYAPLPVANIQARREMEQRKLPTSEGVDLLKMAALDRAKNINVRLKMVKAQAEEHAKDVVRGKGYGKISAKTPVSAKDIANQMAAKLNNKLNYESEASIASKLAGKTADDDGKTFVTIYEEALEINDFPQMIRFKCCQREFVNSLIDNCDVKAAIRGRYYEEDEEGPKEESDDPKLFIEIIGDTEQKVEHARLEITRMVKNELIRIQSRPLSAVNNKSRYSVI